MKKVFLLIILVVGFYQVKAVSFSEGSYLSNTYIKKVKGSKMHYLQLRYLYDQDNSFVYCLMPFTNIDLKGTNYQTYTNNYANHLGISEEQWHRVMLLSYYGYGYINHSTAKWYSVTQFLIWRTVEPTADIYFTDKANGNHIVKYEAEIAEMEALLTDHQQKPAFTNQKITINLNEAINIGDSNQVISRYQFLANNNFIVINEGNSLNIKGLNKTAGTTLFYQKQDSYYHNPATIYTHSTNQNTIKSGSYSIETESLEIAVTASQIKLNITDNKQAYSNEAKFLVVYGLYDKNNNLIEKLTFDKSSQYLTNNLPYGTYFVRQISTGEGYQIDDQNYQIIINSTEVNNLNLPNYLITNEVQIIKYFGNNITNEYFFEENASFEIYDNQNKLVTILNTDNQGQVIINLGYGSYQLKQINGLENHSYTDTNIIVTNNNIKQKRELYNNLFNVPIIIYLEDELGNSINEDLNITIDKEYTISQGILKTSNILFGEYNIIVNEPLLDYEIIDLPLVKISQDNEFIEIDNQLYLEYYIKAKLKELIIESNIIEPLQITPEPEIIEEEIIPEAPQNSNLSIIFEEGLDINNKISFDLSLQKNIIIANPNTKTDYKLGSLLYILILSFLTYLYLKVC